MTLPAAGPTTVTAVKDALTITGTSADARLADIVAAVNELVRDLPVAAKADGLTTWPVRIQEGARLLAVRLYRRKDSPSGVEAFTDLGALYVQRNDPDVAMLLQLGSYMPPGVG